MAQATLSPAAALSLRRTGILIALLGMLMFAMNDVMGKWLVATYSVGQVLLLRSVTALIVIAPLAARTKSRLWPLDRPWLQLARVISSSFEVFLFYYAVISLPLADVMTYWLAAPIYVAALSPLMLGERVGPWRWGAIVMGFVGVLVALRPGVAPISLPVIASLIGSFSFAFMMLTGRALRTTADAALVFWQLIGAAVAGLLTARTGWVTPSIPDVFLLGLLGIVATFAHMAINRSLKMVDAATIAPLQYTLLLWAILFGWLFFGDLPEPAILLGAAIITSSGLLIWFRETRARRAAARDHTAPPI